MYYDPKFYKSDFAVKKGIRSDSSTGIGQIFASVTLETAKYWNLSEKKYSINKMWQALQNGKTNIQYVVATLARHRDEEILKKGKTTILFHKNTIKALLSRYNWKGSTVQAYGEAVWGYYEVFLKNPITVGYEWL